MAEVHGGPAVKERLTEHDERKTAAAKARAEEEKAAEKRANELEQEVKHLEQERDRLLRERDEARAASAEMKDAQLRRVEELHQAKLAEKEAMRKAAPRPDAERRLDAIKTLTTPEIRNLLAQKERQLAESAGEDELKAELRTRGEKV